MSGPNGDSSLRTLVLRIYFAALKRLYQKTCPGAFRSAVLDEPPGKPKPRHPTFSPATETIIKWLDSPDPDDIVMWLDGSADAKKSVICQAVARICTEQRRLSGCFSFRPTATNPARKHDAAGLIATLIYQLLLQIPETQNYIAEKIAADMSILDRSWKAQLYALLVQPLVAVAESGRLQDARARLFIIESLDGCDDTTQCLIVESFAAALAKVPHELPHKLLFSSRSESHLVSTCKLPSISTHLRRLYLDDTASSQDCFELSLVESFTEIKESLKLCQQLLGNSQTDMAEGRCTILSSTRDIQRLKKRVSEAEKERDVLLDRNQALEKEVDVIAAANSELQRNLDNARSALQYQQIKGDLKRANIEYQESEAKEQNGPVPGESEDIQRQKKQFAEAIRERDIVIQQRRTMSAEFDALNAQNLQLKQDLGRMQAEEDLIAEVLDVWTSLAGIMSAEARRRLGVHGSETKVVQLDDHLTGKDRGSGGKPREAPIETSDGDLHAVQESTNIGSRPSVQGPFLQLIEDKMSTLSRIHEIRKHATQEWEPETGAESQPPGERPAKEAPAASKEQTTTPQNGTLPKSKIPQRFGQRPPIRFSCY